ncbi:MAG: hypothetical protein LBR44_04670 [Clostridiales Family XIII bacterium]|jgi:hypothetical protein|nr:hypothetical protein [Clostridiales Family XIII bacterium]
MYVDFTEIGPMPLTYGELALLYRGYKSPHDKIARLAKDGTLIRLKKGLYVPAPSKKTGVKMVSQDVIAGRLYGPSYISLYYALSLHHYDIIPETVYYTSSVTTRRSRDIRTPIGWFRYVHVPEDYFHIGVRHESWVGLGYDIASPEKALCDLIILTPGLRLQSFGAMVEYLEEDIRAVLSDLGEIDFGIFDQVIEVGIKRREIRLLKEVLLDGRILA